MRSKLQLILDGERARRHFLKHPPVFVVGAPRSGTTLLLRVLATHDDFTELFEPWKFWVFVFGTTQDDSCAETLTWRQVVKLRALYYQTVDRAHPILISKDPRDSVRMSLLQALFPSARFVHIVRDPRDSVASMVSIWNSADHSKYATDKDRDWIHVRIPRYKELSREPAHIKAAWMWKSCVDSVIAATSELGPGQKLLLRYEDFVSRPREAVMRLLKYLQVDPPNGDFEPVLAAVTADTAKAGAVAADVFNLSNRWHIASQVSTDAGSGTTSNGTRIGKWHGVLSGQSLKDVVGIVGATAMAVGYEIE